MRTSALRLLFSSALLALMLVFANVSASAAASVCDRVAAVGGSDTAAGTVGDPYGSVQHLVEMLAPGQTGCLRAGVFSEDVTIRHGGSASAPLTLQSFPGERATLDGRLRLARGADYTTVSDLNLIGLEHGHECSRMCASPTVTADHTSFVRDDVTNQHADTICFLLGDSNGIYGSANYTTIADDRIHDCGALPATNYDHGIYVEESVGSQILNNVIYHNADRGIQLYPHAVGTLVRGNVIDANGEGVDFGAIRNHSSHDNLVENNIISNSDVLYNVASAYGPGTTIGTNNVIRENCIGGGGYDDANNRGGIRYDHTGFRLSNNTLATPSFVDRTNGNYTLNAGSPCTGILPGSPPARTAATHPTPRVRHPANSTHSIHIRIHSTRASHLRFVTVTGVLHRPVASGPRNVGTQATASRSVTIRVSRRGHRSTTRRTRTRSDGSFTISLRVASTRHTFLQASIPGLGRSNTIVVR